MRRTVRALKALSQCCQALVQTDEEPELLARVCQIIVNVAGYRLAWVGLTISDEKKTVRPVAQAGFEEGYLETVNITWADEDRGRGPTGAAIRTGKPSIIKDMRSDPRFAPWRDEALRRGYASCVGLPLIAGGATLGAITIYAPEPDAFNDDELGLLSELADNLAYGMTALRTRAAHQEAERLLKESHRDLEKRVELRTRELAAANEQLRVEITQRQQAEAAIRRQREVLKQLLDVYEQHRQLIAYEIHDGVTQMLTGAMMTLEATVLSLQPECAQTTRDGFNRVADLLRKALAESRRLMSGLRPPVLDESGLVAAVECLVGDLSKDRTNGIGCFIDVQFRRLARPLETAIFRIVQEALTNACRYSKSETIQVALTQRGDRLQVEVKDAGSGFDPEAIDSSHFGLEGIRQRARLFGGSATVDSAPGRGTRIVVELPIVEAEEE
jgi:signal transduction histidine kinase